MAAISTKEIDKDLLNPELEKLSPQEILQWAVLTFGARFALQSSMQKTAGVLMHMISQISPVTEIVFVDTGVHFQETLDLRDEYVRRYGLNIKTYSADRTFEEQYGDFQRHLYLQDDSVPGSEPGYRHCCFLRKEVPYLNAVQGRFDAIAGGLMRAEGGNRINTQVLNWDPRLNGWKIYPLALWSDGQVDEYTRANDLPLHPLYQRGYASIGCFTCTTPIQLGEDRRAGRWRHIRESVGGIQTSPIYCGINLEDRRKR